MCQVKNHLEEMLFGVPIGHRRSKKIIMPQGIYKRIKSPYWLGKKRPPISEETRRKLSLVHMGKKGHFKHTEEHKKLLREKMLTFNPFKGKKHTLESRKKMSDGLKGRKVWNKGKKLTESHRLQAVKNLQSKYWLGKKRDKETMEKLRQSRIGSIPWNKGKTGIYSKETLEKISKASRGRKLTEEHKLKIALASSKQNFPFRNTSIEIKLQNFLKEQGIEFQTHYPILGQPDIFIKPNICIFADGCYWHKCPECGFEESIKKERERDAKVTRELQLQGYLVIRMWEHNINKNQFVLSV